MTIFFILLQSALFKSVNSLKVSHFNCTYVAFYFIKIILNTVFFFIYF